MKTNLIWILSKIIFWVFASETHDFMLFLFTSFRMNHHQSIGILKNSLLRFTNYFCAFLCHQMSWGIYLLIIARLHFLIQINPSYLALLLAKKMLKRKGSMVRQNCFLKSLFEKHITVTLTKKCNKTECKFVRN